jgi:hypothetical protein
MSEKIYEIYSQESKTARVPTRIIYQKRIKNVRKGWDDYAYPLLAIESASNAFACCGALCMRLLGAALPKQDDAEADFLLAFLNNGGPRCDTITYYGLATTYQMAWAKKAKLSVLNLLMRMGAVEVDKRPNVVHGPNNLHMIAWCPSQNQEKLKEFVELIPKPLGNDWIVGNQYKAVEKTPVEPQIVPAVIAKSPARDRLGRFTKVTS